ncbi:RIIA lysis inhibitor [Rhizobium phage RHph_N38]|uniref:RIIA protector from prophage-induced early lysis protein n=1 Tax=Rhizobium phage RHph_N38 TaxID=2509750 RepID=A0A7S5R837_9CAUD|nr:RIIA lysis inhibitor [Rhizobium phage RHph_N38]QIG70516.1 rIIA protector from prophage-induced early lysis protein [Rhizobium phage RHph_N38]
MEVAHQTDHTSHVVIGGGSAEKFQMAQTGHFFEILSNTLYANGKLAMIREVLCNAWDSHIASGVMGTAVNISLDANELIIRDYGAGIPHHLIHQIYCIYGNSTKTNDGNQTGGFGLGSKAPFAYTKHFTVTNHHAGTKVVHAISRGTSGDGTPERRVIVDVPTTEQGVEVKIPIKDSHDLVVLEKYILSVAKYGEMYVKLNGKTLERFPLSTSKDGFYVAQDENFGVESSSKVFIRYGNVIYPVENNGEYQLELAGVTAFLDKLPGNNSWSNRTNWKICFQAAPNTISVTPTRESIHITPITVSTFKDLFGKVSSTKTMYEFQELRDRLVREATEHYAKNHPEMLRQFLDGAAPFIKGSDVDSFGKQKPILSLEDARQRLVRHAFKMLPSDYALRLRLLADTGIANRGTLQQLVKAITAIKTGLNLHWTDEKEEPWKVIWKAREKLLKKITEHEGMEPKGLYYINTGSRNRTYDCVEAANWKPRTVDHQFAFLKNKIFLTYSKVAVSEHMHGLVKENGDFGNVIGIPVYVVPRRKDAMKIAIDFFTNKGWEIINVDKYIQDNSLQRVVEVDPTPKAPKIVGIPSLMMLKNPRGGGFTPRGHLEFDVTGKRVEKPKAVFTAESLSGRDYTHKFFDVKMDKVGLEILHLIGEDCAIAVNSRQKEKYIANGSKDGYEFLGEKLWEEFESNTVLVDYFGRFKLNLGTVEAATLYGLWKATEYMPLIKQIMKYPRQLTADEMFWRNIWSHLTTLVSYRPEDSRNHWPVIMRPHLDKVANLIKESKDKPCPERDHMQERIQSSMFKYIDLSKIIHLVSDPKTTKQEKDDAEGILLLALEG